MCNPLFIRGYTHTHYPHTTYPLGTHIGKVINTMAWYEHVYRRVTLERLKYLASIGYYVEGVGAYYAVFTQDGKRITNSVYSYADAWWVASEHRIKAVCEGRVW